MSLEARTILVPAVTWPDLWPADKVLPGVLVVVLVADVEAGVAAIVDLCCSKRFYQRERGFNVLVTW